jgi:hypothetical protein
MDSRLTTEEVTVLRAMRDIHSGIAKVPAHLGPKLKLLGYVTAQGEYCSLTMKGRDELIDRERDAARMN